MGFHGPFAFRGTPQNPRGSGVFATRSCPCLRAERFVGSVKRQPEQITLPPERQSASPSFVALQRATLRTQGTSTCHSPNLSERATRDRVLESLRDSLSPLVRTALRTIPAVVANPGVLLRLRTDSPMCKGCSHGTLLLVNSPGSRSSTRYYHQDLRRRRLREGSRPNPSVHNAATFLLSEVPKLVFATQTWPSSPRRKGIGPIL